MLNERRYRMEFKMPEILSLAATGILGILWFDIRNIRKLYKNNDAGYLTEVKHKLICENSTLRFEAKLEEAKKEILIAIKNNGKGK